MTPTSWSGKYANGPEILDTQGNAQATHEGNLFVGWGILPYFSAFDPGGKLIFNAKFPSGVYSYRAYFLPFSPAAGAVSNQ